MLRTAAEFAVRGLPSELPSPQWPSRARYHEGALSDRENREETSIVHQECMNHSSNQKTTRQVGHIDRNWAVVIGGSHRPEGGGQYGKKENRLNQ